ncbi:hypothetical protein FSP39_003835 [Pinctada imbricata]|uniref:DDE Tnp4 domain-containing protein n=1 Tax=Pinctada imbricata TaxID=66713 RepID=A0AA88XVJ2_PINIB|nr:hypothetical protein FSP39_003835 [Pinctada imbricata]
MFDYIFIYDLQNYTPESSDKELEIDEHVDMELIAGVSQKESCCADEEMDVDTSLCTGDSQLDASLSMHDYCGSTPGYSDIRNQCTQTHISCKLIDACTQTDTDLWTSDTWVQTEKSIFFSYRDATTQVDKPLMTYENIKNSDDKVSFYTGIPNAYSFEALFNEIKDDAEEQTGRKTKNIPMETDETRSRGESGRPRSLRLIDEFLLVLMRIRLGLLLEDLADRFRISTNTCGAIFNKWIDYLDVQFQFLVKWPSRSNIDSTMPYSFQKKYPKCRVVIDCTEIKTETPHSLLLKSAMYSDYKSHMTFKSLVGISPAGVVTFVSDLYTGSTSDKQITNLSGIVDLCEEGDAIMADKGFLISDLTTPKGVDLIIPPFKSKKKAFTPREVRQTKDIANLRIHVERQMERIKNFRILQGVMPISMASQSSKIWKLCTRLTNLQPPLVLTK